MHSTEKKLRTLGCTNLFYYACKNAIKTSVLSVEQELILFNYPFCLLRRLFLFYFHSYQFVRNHIAAVTVVFFAETAAVKEVPQDKAN
jgi:hypothetical protein